MNHAKTSLPAGPGAQACALPGAGFLALILALLFAAGCEKSAPPPAEAPVVDVMKVLKQDVPIYTEWIGTVDGDVNATIRPQVTGYLLKQHYREGQAVKKGQTLFEIDPRTFQTAVDEAKALRSQRQANHTTTVLALARVKPLAAKNAVSQKDLDDATGAELSARAALDQATAALESAKLNLEFTKITSPIDGIAGIAKAQIGDLLSPTASSELTTVSTVDPVRVYVSISERERMRFRQDRTETSTKTFDIPLELILVDGSVYPHPGRFTLFNRQVDVTTGTFKAGAIFANPDLFLRPGQFAKIRATLAVHKDALLVPQRAVTEIQGKYLIGVVGEGNKVELRPVTPGERVGQDWIIKEGLKPGESVVVEGTQKIRPGAVVTPQPYKPAAPAASAPAANPAANPAPAPAPATGSAPAPAESEPAKKG